MASLLSSKLNEEIVRAVTLGDVVDCPPTAFEIWQQLGNDVAVPLGDLFGALDRLVAQNILVSHRGRYALSGRGVLFRERERRYRASVSKWTRARFFLTALGALPGVLAVGFYNALGYGNAKTGSDIDVVVVVRPGSIWRTRFLAVFLAEVFGHRPRPGNMRNGFCLSFFMTPETRMANVRNADDPFLSWWLNRIMVVADKNNTWKQWQENNHWLRDPFPNRVFSQAVFFLPEKWLAILRPVMHALTVPIMVLSDHFMRSVSERFGSRVLFTAAKSGNSSVLMRDDLLKLHLTDRREQHTTEFNARLRRVLRQAV